MDDDNDWAWEQYLRDGQWHDTTLPGVPTTTATRRAGPRPRARRQPRQRSGVLMQRVASVVATGLAVTLAVGLVIMVMHGGRSAHPAPATDSRDSTAAPTVVPSTTPTTLPPTTTSTGVTTSTTAPSRSASPRTPPTTSPPPSGGPLDLLPLGG